MGIMAAVTAAPSLPDEAILLSRRSFLAGGVSTAALLALPMRYEMAAALPRRTPDPALASAADAVQATSKLVTQRGIIGLDFGDVRTVLDDGGWAVFGEGSATGPDRARLAAEQAISELRRSAASLR